MLNIICIKTGYLEENCYIVYKNKKAIIIDPGSEANKIIDEVTKNKLEVSKILITHYHFDHVGALDEIKNKYNVDVIDYKTKGKVKFDDFEFEIIENYGHTLDSVSYYFEKENVMFSGDFIFKESIGKYDIENESIMIESLKSLKKLNKNIRIYPGHGDETTLDYELNHNPFLRGI